jgi:hypothetical protein
MDSSGVFKDLAAHCLYEIYRGRLLVQSRAAALRIVGAVFRCRTTGLADGSLNGEISLTSRFV